MLGLLYFPAWVDRMIHGNKRRGKAEGGGNCRIEQTTNRSNDSSPRGRMRLNAIPAALTPLTTDPLTPPMKPLAPITYDYSGLIAPKDAPPFVQQTGLVEADLKWLAPRLAAARQEVLDNLALVRAGRAGARGNAAAGRRLLRPARAAAGRRAAAVGSDHRRRRPAGQGGRSRAGARHRRLVHGRPGVVRGLLPSVSQRDFPPAARRPAANLLRGQQRRQRRRAGPARSGRRQRRLGHHRHQQERRHAGNGRRLPHLPRRPAKIVRRRHGESSAAA